MERTPSNPPLKTLHTIHADHSNWVEPYSRVFLSPKDESGDKVKTISPRDQLVDTTLKEDRSSDPSILAEAQHL